MTALENSIAQVSLVQLSSYLISVGLCFPTCPTLGISFLALLQNILDNQIIKREADVLLRLVVLGFYTMICWSLYF